MAIFDNHFHLRPTGLGVGAAKVFEKLMNQPDHQRHR